MSIDPKQENRIIRFFMNNPIIGIVGFLGGIASIVALILVLSASKETGELAYQCNPIRTKIVQADRPSSIEVLHNGQKVEGDITAVQIALWNRGKKEILKNDIIKNIVLFTEPPVRILDAELKKIARPEIINLSIGKDQLNEGKIPIEWKILEHNDGAVLQVIYEGKEDVYIRIGGSLIGQRAVAEVKSRISLKNPDQQIMEQTNSIRTVRGFFLLMILTSIFMLRFVMKQRRKYKVMLKTITDKGETKEFEKRFLKIRISLIWPPIFIMLVSIAGIIYTYLGLSGRPPFDF